MSSTQSARYIDVLAIPTVPITFTISLVGRSAFAIVLLPLLYAVADSSGSYALAGTVVGCYGASAGFLAPARAWFIDRFGPRRTLPYLVAGFSGSLTAIALLALAEPHPAMFIALGIALGALAPPLGPTMRVAWASFTSDPPLLRRAFSLDTVCEEVLYLTGPALAGLMLAITSPTIALMVPAVLVLIGGTGFTLTPIMRSVHGQLLARRGEAPRRHPIPSAPSPLRSSRFTGVLIRVTVGGAVAGTITVAIPAFLEAHGPAAAGFALAVFAGGSVVGGITYGAMSPRGGTLSHSLVLSGALIVLSAPVAVSTHLVWVSTVLFVAGLCFSPLMVVAYVAAQTIGEVERQSSATTWVNTAHNLGSALAGAVAGWSIQTMSAPAAVTTTLLGAGALWTISALLPLFVLRGTTRAAPGSPVALRRSDARVRGQRVLEQAHDLPEEPGGVSAVADAVVEDQRELHDATRYDLAVDDPGAFDGPTRTEDRDLGVVDDRG